MLGCNLNNPLAVRDELLRGHVPLGVVGLPADDFKVRLWFCFDVIHSRQHRETPLVGRAFSLGILVFVLAQQLWVQLGNVVGIKAVSAMKCLIDGFYRLLDGVFAITPFVAPGDCHGLPPEHFSVVLIAEPNPGRSTPTHANTNQSLPCR